MVVDIGAGDGFWAGHMAGTVGPTGTVNAAHVDPEVVDKLKKQSRSIPQIKPYICPADGTALPENSCDLAFLSKTYHHLDAGQGTMLPAPRWVCPWPCRYRTALSNTPTN